jgi:hypothetical protein
MVRVLLGIGKGVSFNRAQCWARREVFCFPVSWMRCENGELLAGVGREEKMPADQRKILHYLFAYNVSC